MAAPTIAQELPTGARHRVLWLAVIVYMITYMDRVCISHAATGIREEYGFDAVTMGWIFSGVNLSYALFQIPGGCRGGRCGPRRVLTVMASWWSAGTAEAPLSRGIGSL